MADIKEKRAATLPGFGLIAKSVIVTEVEYTDDAESNILDSADRLREKDIATCYRRVLVAAETGNMRSVAFPVLATGQRCEEVDVAVNACVRGLMPWYAGCTGPDYVSYDERADKLLGPESVTICVFPDENYYDTVKKLATALVLANVAVASLPEKFEEERRRRKEQTPLAG